MTSPRLVFAGTPAFAATHLQALLDADYEVAAVYTQPDRPARRGRSLQASPVKELALTRNLPVVQSASLRGEEQAHLLADYEPDLLVVVAYGLLLPPSILEVPRLGCINVHASLLPRWRGAAPIERAIEAGDAESGVSIMQMDAGLDTGPVLRRHALTLASDETAGNLYQRLLECGPQALIDTIAALAAGDTEAEAQDDSAATHAARIEKAELELDFGCDAMTLERRVRAFHLRGPWTAAAGQRIRVLRARAESGAEQAAPGTVLGAQADGIRIACGEGSLALLELQLPGGRPLPVRDILNGRASWFSPGTRLGGS